MMVMVIVMMVIAHLPGFQLALHVAFRHRHGYLWVHVQHASCIGIVY
jgi:hypothetical protein